MKVSPLEHHTDASRSENIRAVFLMPVFPPQS
nr:MAG TPA: hypothetical protein [Caudoviricetes sp.]